MSGDAQWLQFDSLVDYAQALWRLDWVDVKNDEDKFPSIYELSFGLSRNTTFYLANFVLVTFAVVFSALSVIAVNHQDFSGRSSITYTLLLTMVAFKFVMSSYIPKVNYLTFLDYYNILGMLMVIFVIAENFYVSELFYQTAYYPDRIDAYFAAIFCSIWGGLHIAILTGTYCDAFYLNWDAVKEHDTSIDSAQRVHK